jgi:bifunctional DNA-binding transcriptional regulator/antitoxin component of YhaV-PrlF toxin-antitoxin module
MTVAVKNNNKTPLVVPPAVRRMAGFKSGQELEFKATGGVITIVPKLPATDDEYTAAERRAIDRGIAASEKDYKEGRSYGPFKTHKEFIALLHAEGAKVRAKKRKRPADIPPQVRSEAVDSKTVQFVRQETGKCPSVRFPTKLIQGW